MAIFGTEEIISPADVKERIKENLVQGKVMANHLQFLLRDLGWDGSDILVCELASNILGSFTNSLSMLCAQDPLSAGTRVKRGCYKGRKSSQTRTKVASTMKDEHAWRKYGQKEIHNTKFPRSYFRCSHKYDQNCKAIKQVQMMEENPSLYEITYIDVHTCTDVRKATPPPQMTKDSSPLWDIQPYDELSNTNPPDTKEDMILFSSSSAVTALTMKGEAKDMEINSLLMESDDFDKGSSMYQGFGMDFLLEDDGSNSSMFNY